MVRLRPAGETTAFETIHVAAFVGAALPSMRGILTPVLLKLVLHMGFSMPPREHVKYDRCHADGR